MRDEKQCATRKRRKKPARPLRLADGAFPTTEQIEDAIGTPDLPSLIAHITSDSAHSEVSFGAQTGNEAL